MLRLCVFVDNHSVFIVKSMNLRFVICSCFIPGCFLLLSGCGGQKLPPGIPKLYPATITVIQDGNPLAGAEVVVISTDPSMNWSSGGVTDKNGVVKLRTMGQYDGVPLGKYKVGVRKIEFPDIAPPPEPSVMSTADEKNEYNRIMKEIEDNTFIFVDERFSIGKSQLEVEITPSNLKGTVDVSPAIRVKAPSAPRG